MFAAFLTIAVIIGTVDAVIQTNQKGNFIQDSDCGTTKHCFSDCTAADGCTYEAACSGDGTTASCSLTRKVPQGDIWLAMAFSTDKNMGGDSVTGCKYISSQASIFNAKTTGFSPSEIADTGTTLTGNEMTNGVLRCSFTRDMAEGVNGDRFDLSQPWHWFVVNGGLTAAPASALTYHGRTNRVFSDVKYDLSASPSSNQATTQAPSNFVADAACGSTKSCFSDCSGAATCSYQVACQVSGSNAQCDLAGRVSSGDVYIAWGLSEDLFMGGDSVIGCKSVGGQISVYNSENVGRTSTEYSLESGIVKDSSSLTDGILRCSFTRPLSPSQGSRLFNLSQPWHWLFATGALSGTTPTRHTDKYKSGSKIDLSADPATQGPGTEVTQPTPSSSGTLEKNPDCGVSKGCFTRCDSDTSCTFTVAWSKDPNGLTAVYTLVSDVGSSSGSWIGLGFSADGDMGDDDVIGCLGLGDGTVRVFSAENKGKNPELYNDNDAVLVSGSNQDGVLNCNIRRPVASYTVGSRTRRDLDQPWTLLVARGSGSLANGAVSISYHTANGRFRSNTAFSVSDLSEEAADVDEYPLIKAHGALMIGAWVFLASIGIVAARYYKPAWTVDLCGQKVWFQIHRTCMILVFCTCVAGFIVIFVEVEDWVDIEEKPKYLEGHPIMGTIVTGLCVLNPLMALIRPHPGTKYRPIFNWAHWFVGTGAHILGVVTIFFGFELDKADAPDYLKYILAGYVAWQVLVELTLEMMQCCCARKERKEIYELQDGQASRVKAGNEEPEGVNFAKKLIFVLHFFVVTAISAVLIGLLAVGKRELDS